MESNPPILKKVATVLCAVSILVTAFIPSVGAVETLDFEQSTQPGLLTNSASIQTTEATTELPTEIITELPTEASTEAFTEPELDRKSVV